MRNWIVLGLLSAWLLAGCSQTGRVQDEGNAPLSYDPPGSVVTTDKQISPQERREFRFNQAGVGATNKFEGARLNDLIQVNDSVYTAVVRPENAPVNNSAWYAFKLWAEPARRIRLDLIYEDGTHRYVPKLSPNGDTWYSIDPAAYVHDTTNGSASLYLDIGPDTLWVAGQELITSSDFERWTDRMAQKPYVTKSVIGTSRQGRPLNMLTITEAAEPEGYVLVISRQHPPEVTGTIAALSFLETLAGEEDLARAFRQRFSVLAIPLVNPDGVDNGHWRHNAAGVDLNRDWLHFNQPEVRFVRDAFMLLKEKPGRVYFAADFHSTQEDVFYTLNRDLTTHPPDFIDAWLDALRTVFPDYHVNDDPSGLGSPVSKNWFYESFGAPSLTYELGDEEDRTQIRTLAAGAAQAMMVLLLEEVDKTGR